ncbi:ATP-binding cassette domain-containing protein [Lysinimonas soli]|uniref:ATP-binding cassette domain-containing protein n=1 Tax=Lysinimonas soli TaxID=1074233 RepID=A0ABW0NPL1_9MICO
MIINYFAQIAVLAVVFAMLAASYSVILGTAGVFSAMHAAFFGVGAYTASLLAINGILPFPVDLLAAIVAAGVVGVLVFFPLRRLPGEAILIATIALQLVVSAIITNTAALGGQAGLYGIPRPSLLGVSFRQPVAYSVLTVVIAGIVLALLQWYLSRSSRLATRAWRDQPSLAQSFGIAGSYPEIVAWIIGGGAAAVAGAVYAHFVGYISPGSFGLNETLTILTMLIVGGLGNIWGAVFGAIVLTAVSQALTLLPASSSQVSQLQPILYSVVLIVIVLVRPQGLFPERNVGSRRYLRRAPLERAVQAAQIQERSTGPVVISGITKSYGGLQVLRGIDLELRPNEVTAVLGPNGAGKTTLFNIVAGAERPDGGTVTWGAQTVSGMRSHQLARKGLARSFQDARTFGTFSVFEYMLVAAHSRRRGTTGLFRRAVPLGATGEIERALKPYGLDSALDVRLQDLSYGQVKMLMLAALVYWNPTVVLFDELAAGLDARSTANVAEHVRALRNEERVICLVEHNLEFVWAAADRVVLLGEGRIVADGTPAEIRQDPAAFVTYFGKAEVL